MTWALGTRVLALFLCVTLWTIPSTILARALGLSRNLGSVRLAFTPQGGHKVFRGTPLRCRDQGMKIGTGVLGWDGAERRSDRYGHIHLGAEPYDQSPVCVPALDLGAVMGLVGKRCRVWAIAVETRPSGHVGDLALGIVPSTPEVGERVDLGVGVLGLDRVAWDANPALSLAPEDGRATFWLDPRALYRLHDQTVDLYIEETADPCHPAPDIKPADEVTVATGDGDGSLQSKGRMPKRVAPSFERVGDGMFIMGPPPQGRGERVSVLEHQDDDA